jgi:hypothetical protein
MTVLIQREGGFDLSGNRLIIQVMPSLKKSLRDVADVLVYCHEL